MKNLFTFVLISLSSTLLAQANTAFLAEVGNYNLVSSDIKNYFSSKGLNYVIFNRSDVSGRTYKINDRGEFQIKHWFQHDWHSLQNETTTNIEEYTRHFSGQDFLEAKVNYYKNQKFNTKTLLHLKDNLILKEWGGLNHPPVKQKIAQLDKFSQEFAASPTPNSAFFEANFQKELDHVSDSELTFGNRLLVLEDKESFAKKIELVNKAQSSILLSSLVLICDQTGQALTDALIAKSRQGVKVSVLIDSIVTWFFKQRQCIDQLEETDVKVIMANDFFKYEGRTVYHSKKLVVDLKEAIIGGQNLIDADNVSNGTDFKNRDLDLYVSGPMVQDIALGFIQDWEHFRAKRRTIRRVGRRKIRTMGLASLQQKIEHTKSQEKQAGLRGSQAYDHVLNDPNKNMKGVCRFIQQSPYKDRMSIGKAYLKLMGKTQNYLGIMDPAKMDTEFEGRYDRPFVVRFDTYTMYNQLHQKVLEMGQNNIRLDYITTNIDMAGNEHIDHLHSQIRTALNEGKIKDANKYFKKIAWWNNFFGRIHYKHLIKDFLPLRAMRVWNHISFMHSKVFYFDRIVSSIGSYNFQHNATDHSYENTAICMDNGLNQSLDEIFVRDMANSIPLVYSQLEGPAID